MKVQPVPANSDALRVSLKLLENSLRGGDPLPEDFVAKLENSVATGETSVLVALDAGRVVGVLILDYRLNVSLGGLFASVEDLYVEPESRRAGVGRALLEEVEKRCSECGISYVEVQVEEESAKDFYASDGFSEETGVRVVSRSYPLV